MPEEKNKRLAQTMLPGGKLVEREWMPSERYRLYVRGFSHGAASRGPDPDLEGLGAYDRGYKEGFDARGSHVAAYAKEIGYTPSILRAARVASALLHPNGRCTCAGEGQCEWCKKMEGEEDASLDL